MVQRIAVTRTMASKFSKRIRFLFMFLMGILTLSFISHVITTGADGDIRIWNGVDDDDPNTQCVGEFILYHLYYQQRILTSTDLNTVQAYTYPDYSRDGTEFRFTAPVTCIKANAKVKLLKVIVSGLAVTFLMLSSWDLFKYSTWLLVPKT